MKKPKILLSGKKNLQHYADAVTGTGGIADAGYLPALRDDYDGLVLCGGNDINPAYYNEEMNGTVDIDYERDTVEFALLKAFVDAGKPVFGICRGCQLINVFFGGTLYQDMQNHAAPSEKYPVHGVTAVKGSTIERLYGTDFIVNTCHHQAIKTPGDGLKITLTAADGTVEGAEHRTLPVFAVQWHPEKMCFSESREDAVDGAKIFECFIQLCKENRS